MGFHKLSDHALLEWRRMQPGHSLVTHKFATKGSKAVCSNVYCREVLTLTLGWLGRDIGHLPPSRGKSLGLPPSSPKQLWTAAWKIGLKAKRS